MANQFGTLSSEPTELELNNRALARRAAAESFVLLKNEGGALPLHTNRIALYGIGARKTIKGGLGSGSVEERYSVNIEDGFINAGYEITTQRWLDDYDREYEETWQAYRDMVEEKVARLTNPMKIIPIAHSYVYRYPSGRKITAADVAESSTDTAVYVLARQAGEGNDRKLEQGDYYITDIERENLAFVAENYKHTILVINVGGLIDLAFLDGIKGINAVVLFVQGGEEGGNALADVLSGKVNFSGKLADTIPMRYEDIPFGNEFSHLNGDLQNEYYKEGIYVGYRYYDSFRKDVRYSFGFGLSYTDFSIRIQDAKLDGTKVTLKVIVTNTGRVSGREVIQVYVSVPQNGSEKAYQGLVAFEKTRELPTKETQELEISFDLADVASYDESAAAWMLDAGAYLVRVGNSSRNTNIAAVIHLAESVKTMQCRNCCKATDAFPLLESDVDDESIPADAIHLTADTASFMTVAVDYTEPQTPETDQEKYILDALSIEEMAALLCGGDLQQGPPSAHDIHGSAGKTATSLLEKGIPNICLSDGPAGINIVNRVHALPGGGFAPADIPERYRWGVIAKSMKEQLANIPGPIVYRYATAWPVEMLLAQSWNKALLKEIGDAIGKEAECFGITVWLSPGMNIHRNPLGGRTFEYYSEDPVLTGELAAALTLGVQRHPGIGVSIKHFCCNNTEDNRNGISANVSERALREIYLKGFEIAVRKAQPMTVMSSYNLLNHVYTCNRHDLLTDILRCEWGYAGVVMTDWGACNEKAGKAEKCAPAGNDLIMPGGKEDRERILQALSDGSLQPDAVRRSAARVLRIILHSELPVSEPRREMKEDITP